MKWFKHMTCSFNDEKLSAIVDELGMEGYGFWWRILEVVAEKLDETGDCACTFSSKKWGNFFGFSAKKFEKFVNIFGKKGLFFVEFSENSVTVKIPNLLKYKDEWTRKKASHSGVTPDKLRCKEEDKEEDKEYINTPPPPTGGRAAKKPSRSRPDSIAELRATIDGYTPNPELRSALEAFRSMRERIRKPLTVRAMTLTCQELDKLAGQDDGLKVKIIDQSVQRSWQGVFPIASEGQRRSPAGAARTGMSRQGIFSNTGERREYRGDNDAISWA